MEKTGYGSGIAIEMNYSLWPKQVMKERTKVLMIRSQTQISMNWMHHMLLHKHDGWKQMNQVCTVCNDVLNFSLYSKPCKNFDNVWHGGTGSLATFHLQNLQLNLAISVTICVNILMFSSCWWGFSPHSSVSYYCLKKHAGGSNSYA